MSESKYVSDMIGEDYKNWEPGNKIFVTAQTGSGKTYFILHKLLPHVAGLGRKILYFVNRKVLVKQLREEIKSVDAEYACNGVFGLAQHITIMTYQELETRYQRSDSVDYLFNDVGYIVCDEAHYFINDCLFNTNTIISYWLIALRYNAVPVIFISATMQDLQELFPKVDRCILGGENGNKDPIFGLRSKNYENAYAKQCVVYGKEKNYDYLNINYFKNTDEIPELIASKSANEKWLIFYNDIRRGKELAKSIEETLRKAVPKGDKSSKEVVFIDSDFEKEEESSETVGSIARSSKLDCRICVATSTLDNGISIHDFGLRNVIILAESEMELIQMLGRKRPDSKNVQLYLCTRNREAFQNRLHYVNKLLSAMQEAKLWLSNQNYIGFFEKMMQNEDFYKCSRHFIFQWRSAPYDYIDSKSNMKIRINFPTPQINHFSDISISRQRKLYEELVGRFYREGELAFLNTQLEWLGLPEEAIRETVITGGDNVLQQTKEKVEQAIANILAGEECKRLTKDENVEIKKNQLVEPLKELIDAMKISTRISDSPMKTELLSELKGLYDNIRKTDRPLTEQFNRIMELAELEYTITTEEAIQDNKRNTVYVLKRG